MSSPEAEECEELSPRRCSATTGIECPLPSYEEVVSGAASSLYKPRVDSIYEAHFNSRGRHEDPGLDKKAMAIVLLALILIPMCALIITIQVKVCKVLPSNETLGSASANEAHSPHDTCENLLSNSMIRIEGYRNEKQALISRILELEREVQTLSALKEHPQNLPRLKYWNQFERLFNSIGKLHDDTQRTRNREESQEIEQT